MMIKIICFFVCWLSSFYLFTYDSIAADTDMRLSFMGLQPPDILRIQQDLDVHDHWYVSLAIGRSLGSTFQYTVKAVSNDQAEHLFRMHSLGTPSIYIMPFSAIFASMTNPACIDDLRVVESDSLDPLRWGVESKSIKIVSFNAGVYALPGAKVPYEMLNPIYGGIRTNEMVSFYESPSIMNLSNIVGQNDEYVRVVLYYAILYNGGSLLIREVANVYDPELERPYPLHCFDFVYRNATSSKNVPEKAYLKVFPDRRYLVSPFFGPPPMGNDAFRSPGGIGVNYEYALGILRVESQEYCGNIPYVKSVVVIADPIPDCYGPNSLFPFTTEQDRIVRVSIEDVIQDVIKEKMTEDDGTALYMLRKSY